MAPALVIAGVRSGVGKTTIATGIMGALTRRGYLVQPFKAGPDYIDPSYHKLACGVPSRNLDTWLMPHAAVSELYQRASGSRQISVIEGVMGVFDGHSNLSEEGSTAELAKLLDAPVILVADASKVARSVAAEVLGYKLFDPDLRIAGVILNGVGGPRHLDFCGPQIEATTGLPVLGYLPRREELVQPERHLGLIPTVEGTVVEEWYDTLIAQVEETIDLDRLLKIADRSNPPAAARNLYPEEDQPKRAVIALAQDQAFSFYYQDSLDLLEAWGAELVPFSPLVDSGLPAGAGGVYIGGGFPEMFAQQLSQNEPMLESLRQAVRASFSNSNTEQVSLEGLPAGEYFVKVNRFFGEVPDYTLVIDPAANAPPEIALVSPAAPEVWVEAAFQTLLVTWTAFDPDGDPMWVSLFAAREPVLDKDTDSLPEYQRIPAEDHIVNVNTANMELGRWHLYGQVSDDGALAGDWAPGSFVLYTKGDVNFDGNVDRSDLRAAFRSIRRARGAIPKDLQHILDLNRDGRVTNSDIFAFVLTVIHNQKNHDHLAPGPRQARRFGETQDN